MMVGVMTVTVKTVMTVMVMTVLVIMVMVVMMTALTVILCIGSCRSSHICSVRPRSPPQALPSVPQPPGVGALMV